MSAMEELGGYLSSSQPSQPSPVHALSAGGGPTITYMETMVPMIVPQPPSHSIGTGINASDVGAGDSRCILCDSYISGQAEPPAGINIHGFRLPSTQETLSDKLEAVLQPVCAGTSLHDATTVWQMKHICMACSAALMTLDTYETKILEIREEIARRFMDVMKLRAPHYGPLQPNYQMSHSQMQPSSRSVLDSSHTSSSASLHGGPHVPGLVMVGGGAVSGHSTNGQSASSGAGSNRSSEFVCDICHKSFRNRYNLKRHAGMHTGLRPFSCAHCNRTFRQKDHLKTHLRAGNNDAPLICNLCGGSFACFTQLSEHRRSHHQEMGENGCRHCDQVFSTPTELRRHTRQAHPHPVRAEFRCNICSRAFPNGYNLRRHERTHSGERPFSCNVCGKSFTQLCILKKHELVHQKKLPNVGELIGSGDGESSGGGGGGSGDGDRAVDDDGDDAPLTVHSHHPTPSSTPSAEKNQHSPQNQQQPVTQADQTGVQMYMD